ncbi:hypothetical protein C9374_013468 [Naegleria lovaniensis]|uniref:Phospholipid-transporting ATPase n=1 Tax=Naegleria lovaniensis TaxID=51637 RepID=A0AA88GVV6_NAELO|nr:uncharacterized protein C9374_013468 [Naegleria lovaniensis]KAG2391983.1 hypothetical protein C9374_013468 [Naegleria lovaniensis]
MMNSHEMERLDSKSSVTMMMESPSTSTIVHMGIPNSNVSSPTMMPTANVDESEELSSSQYICSINDWDANKRKKKKGWFGVSVPKFPRSNYLKTTKYTWWNFLFVCFFNQMKKIGNIYFTFIMIIALAIPGVWISGSPLLSIVPIAIILGVNFIREGGEDFFRYLNDRKVNNAKTKVLRDNEFRTVATKDVRVGDIVKVEENEEFPADLVLISSNFEDGSCSIETSNLDGESALKSRYSPSNLSTYNTSQRLSTLKGVIKCQEPNQHLHKFRGSITVDGVDSPISHQNLLLKGSVLKSGFIHGVVVYTGKDTKVAKNMQQTTLKFSFINTMTNFFISVMFGVMAIFVVLFVILEAYYEFTYARKATYTGKLKPIGISDGLWVVHSILVFVVLFNLFVPASLFVTLEFVKAVQARFISIDNKLCYSEIDSHTGKKNETKGAAISSDLHSDLSQVDVIVTDKTGTLTENSMNFNKLWLLDGPTFDDTMGAGDIQLAYSDEARSESNSTQSVVLNKTKTVLSDEQYFTVMVSLLTLSLCHNVTVRIGDNDKITYDGESPDEIALVKGASNNGFVLKYFTEKKTILSIFNKEYTFERLAEIAFTPERKRMSTLFNIPTDFLQDYPIFSKMALKHNVPEEDIQNGSGLNLCLIKGADTFVYPCISKDCLDNSKQKVESQLLDFSKEGLRSLVLAYKFVPNSAVNNWLETYYQSKKEIVDSKQLELLHKAESEMENQMTICGATGIEDRLQVQVPETLKFFFDAGLKIWMATGDARDSAIHIAKISKLVSEDTPILYMEYNHSTYEDVLADELLQKISQMPSHQQENLSLVMDGHVMNKTEVSKSLVTLLEKCKTVICYRSTPKQKASLVQLLRSKLKKNCLAIGDGANDVSMIQKAKVGVAIIGKEGQQAKLASDYAIPKFFMLKRLLAVHGRYSFKRSAQFVQYSFYKNTVIAFVLVLYNFYNLYSGQTLFDGWVITFQNYIFTLWNPFIFGLIEKDITEDFLEDPTTGPTLFKNLRKENVFNWFSFIKWIFGSFIHAVIIFFFNMYGTEPTMLANGQSDDLWLRSTLVYTCVFAVVTLKCFLEMEHYTILHGIAMLLSVLCFTGYVIVYTIIPSALTNVWFMAMRTPTFWFILLLCVATCLGIDLIFVSVKVIWFPDMYLKLRMQHKKNHHVNEEKDQELQYTQ